jgi:hypothetical protein
MTDVLSLSPPPAAPLRRPTSQRAGLVAGIIGLVLGCLVILGGTLVEHIAYSLGHCFWSCSPETEHHITVRFWTHMALASLCLPAAVALGVRLVRRTRPAQPS